MEAIVNFKWTAIGLLGLGSMAALGACKKEESAPAQETAALTPANADKSATSTATAAAAETPSTGSEQYFPLQSYRVGPYAAGGTGFFGGFIDYLQLVNARDGGVGGVKLTWSECETEY